MCIFDNKLWVGTLNIKTIPWSHGSEGCEVRYYNGTKWTKSVGNDGEDRY